MKKRSTPSTYLMVETYDEFRADIRRFAERKYANMLIVGAGGIGKTQTLKALVGDHILISGGLPTAFQFYCKLYANVGATLILDDLAVDFYKNSTIVSMLKILMDTAEGAKWLAWHTSKLSEETETPNTFETTSRVCILTNEWASIGPHMQALEDRMKCIVFKPSAAEVHREVRAWFDDDEVYDFVGEYVPNLPTLSMRKYVAIRAEKLAGADWRERGWRLLFPVPRDREFVGLLRDGRFASNRERCREFIRRGLGKETTFNALLRRYRPQAPAIAEAA